ncbi:cell wall hydrolase [Alkaliphilus sp. B6464]|uniref:cell wall hydrolase n=1 Tax=Alkaliphilus sp. B6464 TaxID=2731219 RepID=UPI001BA49F0C|nr:cell wall hydrolase [Alkaliphilus sp. B6464]QUH22124.1 cell wall hydrolase [Alkaliphilus sp. B6464]
MLKIGKKKYRIVNKKRFFISINLILSIIICSRLAFANTIKVNDKIEVDTNSYTSVDVKELYYLDEFNSIKDKHVETLPVLASIASYKQEPKLVNRVEPVSRGNNSTRKIDINITDEEIELLERLVHAEAKGESFNGKIAVANVVFNRVRSNDFPNTVKEVILQKGQFSPINNGSIKNKPSQETKDAVEKALEGFKVVGDKVLYFLNRDIATNAWIPNNKEFAIKIGNHSFYFE